MPDYPDWQRAYRLVGVDVTVPISISAATVTLNVDIVAQTVGNLSVNLAASAITLNVNLLSSSITLNVNVTNATLAVNITGSTVTLNVNITNTTVDVRITASTVTLNVNLSSSSITLNVNLAAAAVTVNIKFTDQSVAVFDAAKWFAHQAAQIFVNGFATVNDASTTTVASRTVPTGKTFFIVGMGWSVGAAQQPYSTWALLQISGNILSVGSYRGGGVMFDTPVRATAGQVVALGVTHHGSGANFTCWGSFWGYDE